MKNGDRVTTPLGEGIVTGKESFYEGRTVRFIVRLNDPSRWSGSHIQDPAFFAKEVTLVEGGSPWYNSLL